MSIQTELTIEQLTNNLKKALSSKHNLILKDLKAREILAITLGFKNANTMLGILNKELSSAFEVDDYVVDLTNNNYGIGRIVKNNGYKNGIFTYTIDFGHENNSVEVKDCDIELLYEGNFNFSCSDNAHSIIVNCTITTDDQNMSISFNIVEYLKFLNLNELNSLYENMSCSTESDSVYWFFSRLGVLSHFDYYLDYKNTDIEETVGFSVDINKEQFTKYLKSIIK